VCVEAHEVPSRPQIFCALLWELRGPISMRGEMFWKIYYLIRNLLILHLNIEN
jgi:hypothetical protein